MTIRVMPDSPLPRRFTTGDLRSMLAAGILREDERVELLDGELVEMAAKGFAHDVVKNALMRRLVRALPDSIYLGIESTLQLGPNCCWSRTSSSPRRAPAAPRRRGSAPSRARRSCW